MTVGRVHHRVPFEHSKSGFIGRRRELSTLAAALERARSGLGGIFLLSGEAGIGKTLLAREFSLFAREGGAKVLEGRASERFRDIPLAVWQQILTEQAKPANATRADFLSPDPALVPAASVPLQRIIDHQIDSELFESTVTAVVEQAKRQPLVVVLDDLHAADPLSLRAFRVLARELPSAGSLIVGVYRDSESSKAREFADLLLDPMIRDSKRIALAAFDDEETREFAQLRAASPLNEGSLAVLRTLTGGNPRLLEIALRRQLLDETSLGPQAWPGGPMRTEIAAHLEHLSERTKQVLSTAALAGVEFRLTSLFHVLNQDPRELLDALHEAEQSGLLSRTEIPGSYRFRQALIREILAAELSGARRAQLHERFGEVLESLYRHDDAFVERIASHFYEAVLLGDAEKAADYCTRAAGYALSRSRPKDAFRFYHMALAARELQASSSHTISDLHSKLAEISLREQNFPLEAPWPEVGSQAASGPETSITGAHKALQPGPMGPVELFQEAGSPLAAVAPAEGKTGGDASDSDDSAGETSTEIPENIFRREGDFWTLTFKDRTLRLRHANGLLFVAHLLQNPDRDLHVAQLVAILPAPRAIHPEALYISHSDKERLGMHVISEKNSNPLLDRTAKAEYRRRIDELRDALEHAKACNDFAKAEELERELEIHRK